jgi:hypothetical protein
VATALKLYLCEGQGGGSNSLPFPLCSKETFAACQMTLVFVVHLTDHDIRVYCLGLRLISNSLFASSETEQAAMPYDRRAVIVRKGFLQRNHQLEPLGNVFQRSAIVTYDRSG